MSKCLGLARRLHGRRPSSRRHRSSWTASASLLFSFTDTSPCAATTLAGRVDNLVFAKTILSQSGRILLSSAVAFGLDRHRFQSQGESGVRRDVDEGVRPAHE